MVKHQAAAARELHGLKTLLETHGALCVDTAYLRDAPDSYDHTDLHVGYRLHTHLYFVSKRKPSYLLNGAQGADPLRPRR